MLLLGGKAGWGLDVASGASPLTCSCCAGSQWNNNFFLKHLTSFGRLKPDDEGFSGEDIFIPRLGVRVLVGLFHRYLILPAAE